MATSNTQSYEAMMQRIRNFSSEAKAASEKGAGATAITETDDRDQGDKSIPTDPANTEEKQNLPPQQDNLSTDNEDKKIEDKDLHPVSTGKNVPSTEDGNAKDDACTEPNTPISKISSDEIQKRAEQVVRNLAAFGQSGSQPKEASAADKTEGGESDKKADDKNANTALARDFSAEHLLKLGSIIVETEGGLQAVEPILRKRAGQEEVGDLLQKAAAEHDQLSAYAEAYEQVEQEKRAAEQEMLGQAEQILAHTPEEELQKLASALEIHEQRKATTDEPRIKRAYDGGVEDAAAMMDAGGAPAPEEAVEGGAPDLEELVDVLDQMVESGEISEEEATAIVEMAAGGGGGEMAEGGGMPMPEGGGMAPPELGGMVAAASDKSGEAVAAQALVDKLAV